MALATVTMDHIQTVGEGCSRRWVVEARALVIMRRDHGFMAAVSEVLFSAEELTAGSSASMEDAVGPSHRVTVAAGLLGNAGILPQPGVTAQCMIIDFSALAASRFTPMVGGLEPEALIAFMQIRQTRCQSHLPCFSRPSCGQERRSALQGYRLQCQTLPRRWLLSWRC